MCPVEATVQQTTRPLGGLRVVLSSPGSGSIKEKNSLCFQHHKKETTLTTVNIYCPLCHKAWWFMLHPVPSPGSRHKQTLHPSPQTAETRGPVPGEVIILGVCERACVCVVGSYCSQKMKTAALAWYFKRRKTRFQLDCKTQPKRINPYVVQRTR